VRFYFLCPHLRSEIPSCVTQNFHEALAAASFGPAAVATARNFFWIRAVSSQKRKSPAFAGAESKTALPQNYFASLAI
jgi:hypothetical protein